MFHPISLFNVMTPSGAPHFTVIQLADGSLFPSFVPCHLSINQGVIAQMSLVPPLQLPSQKCLLPTHPPTPTNSPLHLGPCSPCLVQVSISIHHSVHQAYARCIVFPNDKVALPMAQSRSKCLAPYLSPSPPHVIIITHTANYCT